MSQNSLQKDLIPQRLVNMVLCLLALILGLVSFAVFTEQPLVAQPPEIPVVKERVVHMKVNRDGTAVITGQEGEIIQEFASNRAGFVSMMERTVQRQRQRAKADASAPIVLRAHENGSLSIFDPSVDNTIRLGSFGDANIAVFARLLDAG